MTAPVCNRGGSNKHQRNGHPQSCAFRCLFLVASCLCPSFHAATLVQLLNSRLLLGRAFGAELNTVCVQRNEGSEGAADHLSLNLALDYLSPIA